ncbi:MAG TPA: hypothetical protein VIM69_05070 [Opitutaceae bacterium]
MLSGATAHAFYAPIPVIEQGKPLTVYLSGTTYYDTNVFGAETGKVESMVYEVAPSFIFNAGVAQQSFLSLSYKLSVDYIPDRPGSKVLPSHDIGARVAHTFSADTEFDVTDSYVISRNPESLLPGVGTVLSGDQSYRRNQLDARLNTTLTQRNGVVFKTRVSSYDYDNFSLGQELNRNEFLGGVSLEHTVSPGMKVSTEYRYQAIEYTHQADAKNKYSHFLLFGAEDAVNDRTAFTAKAGGEYRERSGDTNILAPYVELGVKRDYGRGSFVSAGYSYSLEETSTIDLFDDMAVNRFFVNCEQAITPKLTGSASVDWEPSILEGRRNVSPNRNEVNTRIGLALIYRLEQELSFSATIDIDQINSDQPGRSLSRQRYGVSAKYAF